MVAVDGVVVDGVVADGVALEGVVWGALPSGCSAADHTESGAQVADIDKNCPTGRVSCRCASG